jgi:hypothetical protein
MRAGLSESRNKTPHYIFDEKFLSGTTSVGVWGWLQERQAWQRVARVSEQLACDAVITIVFMLAIYCVGTVARWLNIDKDVVVHGITIADIVHMLHAANLVVNGYFALKHLVTAHRHRSNQ